jgi:hypothetical protein
MKVYQVVWYLVKKWRSWRDEVTTEQIAVFFLEHGIRLNDTVKEKLNLMAMLRPVNNPTPEDVERFQQLARIGRFTNAPREIEELSVGPKVVQLATPEEADAKFWATANKYSAAANKDQIDMGAYEHARKAIIRANEHAMYHRFYDLLIPEPPDLSVGIEYKVPRSESVTVNVEGVEFKLDDQQGSLEVDNPVDGLDLDAVIRELELDSDRDFESEARDVVEKKRPKKAAKRTTKRKKSS